jgi:hypothetical protein
MDDTAYGDDTLPTNQGADISPQSANPNAESWMDVLKFGLSRVIDARTRQVSPENTSPRLKPATSATSSPAAALLADPKVKMALLLIAGVVVVALVMKRRA